MSTEQQPQPYRVLIAKPGLDGHDRGAKFIAQALRDEGFEVIYTGIRRTPEEIAQAAIQEDVAALGLSSLSGAHGKLFPAVLAALREAGADDIPVLGGGVIPEEDLAELHRAGIDRIFTPGTPLAEIIAAFREACREHHHRRRNLIEPEVEPEVSAHEGPQDVVPGKRLHLGRNQDEAA